jgi:hypothetical protein
MNMPPQRLFQIVLFAYPRDFRRDYGQQMEQFFRDCYRAERVTRGRLGLGGLWVPHPAGSRAHSSQRAPGNTAKGQRDHEEPW